MRYLPGVATLALDREACTGCGVCAAVCPHRVFRMADGKASIADLDACMECGACARNCAWGALKVEAGVGCAQAILHGMMTGSAPSCGCASGPASPCCGGPT
ncbi:MAG: 4Fe-4S binding protein [Elusimicrobia bacterium]|nr:4Fe-4S binding protein [Elusimicrobiota bacterium]